MDERLRRQVHEQQGIGREFRSMSKDFLHTDGIEFVRSSYMLSDVEQFLWSAKTIVGSRPCQGLECQHGAGGEVPDRLESHGQLALTQQTTHRLHLRHGHKRSGTFNRFKSHHAITPPALGFLKGQGSLRLKQLERELV